MYGLCSSSMHGLVWNFGLLFLLSWIRLISPVNDPPTKSAYVGVLPQIHLVTLACISSYIYKSKSQFHTQSLCKYLLKLSKQIDISKYKKTWNLHIFQFSQNKQLYNGPTIPTWWQFATWTRQLTLANLKSFLISLSISGASNFYQSKLTN